jgi:hypothetical protein
VVKLSQQHFLRTSRRGLGQGRQRGFSHNPNIIGSKSSQL